MSFVSARSAAPSTQSPLPLPPDGGAGWSEYWNTKAPGPHAWGELRSAAPVRVARRLRCPPGVALLGAQQMARVHDALLNRRRNRAASNVMAADDARRPEWTFNPHWHHASPAHPRPPLATASLAPAHTQADRERYNEANAPHFVPN